MTVWLLDMRDAENHRAFCVMLFDSDHADAAAAKPTIRREIRRLGRVCPACGQYAVFERGQDIDGHEIIQVDCATCGRYDINRDVAGRLWAENLPAFEDMKPRLWHWLSRTKDARPNVPYITYDWPYQLSREWAKR